MPLHLLVQAIQMRKLVSIRYDVSDYMLMTWKQGYALIIQACKFSMMANLAEVPAYQQYRSLHKFVWMYR